MHATDTSPAAAREPTADSSEPTARPEPTALATVDSGPGAALSALATAAEGYAASAKASATQRAYRRAWGRFEAWCGAHGIEPLPAQPTAVALYATCRSRRNMSPPIAE